MTDAIDFDVEVLQTFRFRNLGRSFELREATGSAAGDYRKAAASNLEWVFDDEHKTRTMKRVANMMDLEPLLVSLCCFDVTDDPNGKPVSVGVVKSWKASVQRRLWDEAVRINPWISEAEETLEQLKEQRTKLDARIARVEAAKAHPNGSAGSSAGS